LNIFCRNTRPTPCNFLLIFPYTRTMSTDNMTKTGLYGKTAEAGRLVWVHYNVTPGQSQYGDYGYVKGYAPNRSEKVEDGETYVKAKIVKIFWLINTIRFVCVILKKDGTEGYRICIDDPSRLTVIER